MRCGKCGEDAASVATVKACYAGEREACGWIVAGFESWVDEETGEGESWPVEKPCGAHVTFTERGWSCEAGHEHVSMQARAAEGWDYAEEYGEAMSMAMAGVEPVTMSGHVVLGPESFAQGWADR